MALEERRPLLEPAPAPPESKYGRCIRQIKWAERNLHELQFRSGKGELVKVYTFAADAIILRCVPQKISGMRGFDAF